MLREESQRHEGIKHRKKSGYNGPLVGMDGHGAMNASGQGEGHGRPYRIGSGDPQSSKVVGTGQMEGRPTANSSNRKYISRGWACLPTPVNSFQKIFSGAVFLPSRQNHEPSSKRRHQCLLTPCLEACGSMNVVPPPTIFSLDSGGLERGTLGVGYFPGSLPTNFTAH